MNLKLKWHRSVNIGTFPYSVDTTSLPTCAGIYVFYREHGNTREALYVGKANNLAVRIKQQLNALGLMTAIQKAENGARKLVFAEWIPKSGQQPDVALPLCEKALIRYYLEQGHGLVNIHGTRLKFHELDSDRSELRKFLPRITKLQDE